MIKANVMTRQALSIACVANLLLVSVCRPAEAADELAAAIQPLVDAHEGDVTVAIKNLKTGESYEHHADKPMPTASLIKFPLMIAAYQAMADGKLKPDQMITLKDSDKVPGSGILTEHFSGGDQISLRDAIRLMIVYSDNTATNLVINQVGLKPVAELMEKLGCPETKLNSKVFLRDTSIFPDRSKKYGLGSTTAADMVKLLEMLQSGRLVSEDASKKMLEHMYACDDKLKFRRYLPNVKIAHKSGSVNTTRCEAGLIDCPEGPIALCVMTNDNKDQSWGEDNAAEILCGRIAQLAYRRFNPQGEAGAKPSGKLILGDSGPLVAALHAHAQCPHEAVAGAGGRRRLRPGDAISRRRFSAGQQAGGRRRGEGRHVESARPARDRRPQGAQPQGGQSAPSSSWRRPTRWSASLTSPARHGRSPTARPASFSGATTRTGRWTSPVPPRS